MWLGRKPSWPVRFVVGQSMATIRVTGQRVAPHTSASRSDFCRGGGSDGAHGGGMHEPSRGFRVRIIGVRLLHLYIRPTEPHQVCVSVHDIERFPLDHAAADLSICAFEH